MPYAGTVHCGVGRRHRGDDVPKPKTTHRFFHAIKLVVADATSCDERIASSQYSGYGNHRRDDRPARKSFGQKQTSSRTACRSAPSGRRQKGRHVVKCHEETHAPQQLPALFDPQSARSGTFGMVRPSALLALRMPRHRRRMINGRRQSRPARRKPSRKRSRCSGTLSGSWRATHSCEMFGCTRRSSGSTACASSMSPVIPAAAVMMR